MIEKEIQKSIRECRYKIGNRGPYRFMNYHADPLAKQLTPYVYAMIKKAVTTALREHRHANKGQVQSLDSEIPEGSGDRAVPIRSIPSA